METICMKYQIQFSGKNKKNTIHLSSAKFFSESGKVKKQYCDYIDKLSNKKKTIICPFFPKHI